MKLKFIVVILFLVVVQNCFAMHIMEGFLESKWALVWFIISGPFVVIGYRRIKKITENNKKLKLLIAMVAAFALVLSALKIPSVTGSCSHPTGVGLGAVLFGPFVMSFMSVIILLFQALFLAHGGVSTLGANIFSMGVVGPVVTFLLFVLLRKLKVKQSIAVFAGAMFGSISTYLTTSIQLGMAFPMAESGIWGSFVKFSGIFAVTQIPIAISEGILTVILFNIMVKYSYDDIAELEKGESINEDRKS